MTQFFVPPPDAAAVSQITSLIRQRDFGDAVKLAAMEATPRAVWFDGGTPREVEKSVRQTMDRAAAEGRVPVLVAYDIPFRDCAQYSSGGAVDTASYEAWIAGFARGIGRRKAVVILEPDSLGIIPYNTTIFGSADWCKPTVTDATGATVPAPGASSDERYAQLQGAIATLTATAPGASVYLDGTHSDWLGVERSGVSHSQGRLRSDQRRAAGEGLLPQRLELPAHRPAGPVRDLGLPVSGGGDGRRVVGHRPLRLLPEPVRPGDELHDRQLHAGVRGDGDRQPGEHVERRGGDLAVRDRHRPQRAGPLDTTPFAAAPYDQPASVVNALGAGAWCNPPGAGAGLRPTASTGVPLVDAYLWIKTPGESDGACAINGGARAWDFTAYNPWNVTGDAQNAFDPLWGMVDPAAGAWFPAQALQLAQQAVPAIL